MKKNKLTALLMSFVMLSGFVAGCQPQGNSASSSSNSSKPGSDIIGVNGEDQYEEGSGQGEATGSRTEIIADNGVTDEQYEKMFAKYKKQAEADKLQEYGIGKDDYVWTIVTLNGKNLVDRYLESGSRAAFSDYAVSSGVSYKNAMLAEQNAVKERISSLDKNAEYSFSYTVAQNGFAVKLKYGEIETVKKLSGVKDVAISEYYAAPTGSEIELYASEEATPESGAGNKYLAEQDAYMGEGMLVAVIDSAIDTDHPAFNGDHIDMNRAKVDTEYMDRVITGTQAYEFTITYGGAEANTLSAKEVYTNNKLVFSYDYGNKDKDANPEPAFAEKLTHGTHTAGIAVGYDTSKTLMEGEFRGVAPNAQLAFMKVFYEDSVTGACYSKDEYIAAALEDCILLGVDTVNMSLGAARGFSVDNSSANYIYTYCKYADLVGINVQASVGNNFSGAYQGVNGDYPLSDYPDYGSVNSPASYDSTLSIGSYNGENVVQYYADVNAGTEKACKVYYTEQDAYTDTESSDFGVKHFVTDLGAGSYDWVYVANNGTYEDFKAADVSGKIALVKVNDKISVNEQMACALRFGAVAVMYVDATYRTTRTVNCVVKGAVPYCGLARIDADRMLATGTTGTIAFSLDRIQNNDMSIFSSWGATNTLNIQPDIVAVGGNVYSSLVGRYGLQSGTSMASPMAVGYITRLRQAYAMKYPSLTEVQLTKLVESVVMSTATTLSDLNGNTYSPRYQGAGAINYEAALNTKSYITVAGQTKPKIELGEDAERKGVYALSFNINNVDAKAKTYALSVDAMTDSLCGDGKTVTLLPHMFKDFAKEITVAGSGVTLSGDNVNVPAGGVANVAVKLTLTAEEKAYIDDNFRYGSFVEGFVKAASTDGEALSVPFLAFYGDWEESPLMDKTSFDSEDAYLFASSLIGTYNGGYTSAYLGKYPYTVPEGYEDIEFDARRLAIGSKMGGYVGISSMYLGLLRNADKLEFNIFNKYTGEVYEYHTISQIGKAGFIESAGQMYPVIQNLSFGADMPNNTIVTFTVRASLDSMGQTINAKDAISFDFYVDNETPKMYSDSVGVYQKRDKSVWLSLNVYDNHVLSCISLYTYKKDGTLSDLLSAPIPVNLDEWKYGEKNTLEFEITDFVDSLETNTVGVILEDAAMNRASHRLVIHDELVKDEEDTTRPEATSVECLESINLAINYSSNLGIKTVPTNAKYTLEVDETYSNTGRVEIDEARGLVVAREAGEVRIKVTAGSTTKYVVVNIYAVDGEWVYELITAKSGYWGQKYDPEKGRYVHDDTYDYDPENGKTTKYYSVYAYRGEGSHVVIPSTYTDAEGSHEVIDLGFRSFFYCMNMYSVEIPNTIRNITNEAFFGCHKLTDVKFQADSKVNTIGSMAFEDCFALEEITIPKTVMSIGSRAFFECNALKRVEFEAYTVSAGAKLRDIQYSAFANTAITEFRIPESCVNLGSAIAGTAIKTLILPESLPADNVNLARCTELESVTLSAATTKIGSGAFSGCVKLKKIVLPETVTSIGSYAFSGCSSLTSIKIPHAVTKIDDNAFEGCTNLVSVTLGNGVEKIGKEAFYGDVSLRIVYFDKLTNPDLGTDVFYGCANFVEFSVNPSNEKYMSDDGILYRRAEGVEKNYILYNVPISKRIERMVIRPDVSEINSYAFAYHTELKAVMFPTGGALNKIGEYAFAGCSLLDTVNLENADSLTSLGTAAFMYCTALKAIKLPDSLTKIPSGAFTYCVYLEKVTFGSKVESIEPQAFAYCIRFRGTDGNGTLKLPATLSMLGERAFYTNRQLNKVDMSECSALDGSWGMNAFVKCINLKEVVLAPQCTEIYSGMFAGCSALEKINLQDTQVTKIWTGAFSECSSLDNVQFPATINKIYTQAFEFCTSLTSIVIPHLGAGGSLAPRAFQGCTSLASVTLPDDLSELGPYTFAEAAIKEIKIPSGLTQYKLSEYAFHQCYNLERYIVDEDNQFFGVTDEGILYVKTFESQLNGKTVTVPNTLFACPLNLQAKVLDLTDKYAAEEISKFDVINSAFFRYTTGIEKVIIPASIKKVGAGAFFYSAVKEVEFAADSPVDFDPYDDYAIFAGAASLEKVTLPRYCTNIPVMTFQACTNLKEVVLPETVTAIYEKAFQGCESLESLNIENVEELYGGALSYCKSIKSFTLGAKLHEISNEVNATVFEGCESLEEIKVDAKNKKYKDIDGVLFDKTGSLLLLYPANKAGEEYSVPAGVTKINEVAFAFNKNLKKVVLPETLTTIATFAFYQTEKLDTYVFLSRKAPVLEGQFLTSMGGVVYTNFYDLHTNEFEYPLYMYYPEGGTGYDLWIYGIFFFESHENQQAYESPEQSAIPEYTLSAGSQEVTTDYVERFDALVDELKTKMSRADAKEQLEALRTQYKKFNEDFFDLLYADEKFAANMYASYEKEAQRLCDYAYPWFSVSMARINDIYDLVEKLLAENVYSETYRAAIDDAAYYAQYKLLNVLDSAEAEELYTYYVSFLNGIPSTEQEAEFTAFIASKKAELEQAFANVNRTEYSEGAYAYILNKYNGTDGEASEGEEVSEGGMLYEIQQAVSKQVVADVLSEFNAMIEQTVKLATAESFEAFRTEQLARFDKYVQENYEITLWILIDDYIQTTTAKINESYRRDEITEIMDAAVKLLDYQDTKFTVEVAKVSELLISYVDYYNMYYNLFDEDAKALRAYVESVESQIKASATIEEAYAALDEGFENIWKFYEYNQRAYKKYREAVQLFATLEESEKQEAMKELSAISYRVAANYEQIAELIAKYTQAD